MTAILKPVELYGQHVRLRKSDVLGIGSREDHRIFCPSVIMWDFEMCLLTSKA